MPYTETLLLSEVTIATIFFAISSFVSQTLRTIPEDLKDWILYLPYVTTVETLILIVALFLENMPMQIVIPSLYIKILTLLYLSITLTLFILTFLLISYVAYRLYLLVFRQPSPSKGEKHD